MAAIHIAFGDSAAGNLKAALKIIANKPGQPCEHCLECALNAVVLSCSDQFSIGPIFEMDLPSGFFDRVNWMGDFLEDCLEPDMTLDDVDDLLEKISDFYKKLAWIENEQNVVIWHGKNVIDQIGVRLLANLLPDCQLYEIDLENAVLCSKFEKYSHQTLATYDPEFLEKLLDFVQPISEETKQHWSNEWENLVKAKGLLRIWSGSAIETVEIDYFDEALLRHCSEFPRSAAKVIADVLAEGVCETGENFLYLRLRQMAKTYQIVGEGDLESFKEFHVMQLPDQIV